MSEEDSSDNIGSANTNLSRDDSFVESTTQGWGSRLARSFVGVLFGIILVPAAIFLLYWNEGRAVDAIRALDQGAGQVVEAVPNSINPASDGKLVHISGLIETSVPARDPLFGVSGEGLLRLARKVEMYQWKEEKSSQTREAVGGSKTTETTYSYRRVWSAQAINSSGFKDGARHRNPAMPLKSEHFESDAAKLGAFQVEPSVVAKISDFSPLIPKEPPALAGYRAEGDVFYRGQNPAEPQIADIRVSFEAVKSLTASLVAAQIGGRLAPYHANNGYEIVLAKPGLATAAELFREKKQEESFLTWILRGAGFIGMLAGFLLVSRPLAIVFAFLPFLEGIIGAGVHNRCFDFRHPTDASDDRHRLDRASPAHRRILDCGSGRGLPCAVAFPQEPQAGARRADRLAQNPTGPVLSNFGKFTKG